MEGHSYYGRNIYADQKVYISGMQIAGVQAVDGRYNLPVTPVKALGQEGAIINEDPGVSSLEANFSVDRIVVTNNDPLTGFFIDDSVGISGHVIYDEDKAFAFDRGFIDSYSSSCAINELPTLDFSMTVYGGNIGGVGVPTGRSIDQNNPLYVARPGDIAVNVSGWECNRVQSYSYEIIVERTPLETIGDEWSPQGFIVQYPIEVNVSFSLEVDGYRSKRFLDFICQPHRQDLEIVLNDCGNRCGLGSGIRTFRAPHSRLISYDQAGSIDSALTANLQYKTYITNVTGIADLIN